MTRRWPLGAMIIGLVVHLGLKALAVFVDPALMFRGLVVDVVVVLALLGSIGVQRRLRP